MRRRHGYLGHGVRLAGAAVAVAVALLALLLGLSVRSAEGSGESPLAQYPGFGHDPVADEARFAAEERRREAMIAACMQRKGFRYVASPSVVVEGEAARGASEKLVANDPNNRHLTSLSPTERRAYSLALAGVPDADRPSGPIGGCIGEAHRAVPGVYAAYGALLEPFEQLQATIAADVRVRAAESRWAACMRSRGHTYPTRRALASALDGSPFGTAAAAGRACEEEAGIEPAWAAARNEHEARFVARHRALLERFGRR